MKFSAFNLIIFEMVEKKELIVCKDVAENIRALEEALLRYHPEVPPYIAKIVRDWARKDHEIHEAFRGTGSPLDIYTIPSKARTLSDTGG